MFRDLTLVPIGGGDVLVIACDSLGGIGSKVHDLVKTTGEVVGRYTVRVPLMEVIAAGASPIVVVNTLSVEMEPSGQEILYGMRQEMMEAGLGEDFLVTGSTEENVPMCQTALGVTVIGKAVQSALRLGKARVGDVVVCVGRPKVGDEVLDGTPAADVLLVRRLLALPWVREILPVGSKGVLYEAKLMAEGAGAVLNLGPDSALDVKKSAGPATCVLVAMDHERLDELTRMTELPIFRVGRLDLGSGLTF
jgi:hypothetical protein